MAMAKKPKQLNMTFGQAFKDAGGKNFTWKDPKTGAVGKFSGKTKTQVSKAGTKKEVKGLKKKKRAAVKSVKGFKAKRAIRKTYRAAKKKVKSTNKALR